MPRRRAIAAVPIALAGLSVGLLGGCSTASPTSAPTTTTTSAAASSSETATSTEGATPTTVASASATEAATTPTVTSTAPAPAPTASAAPAPPLVGPLPTDFTPLGKVIKEDALGHEVAVLRMARVLPWPTGSTGQSAAFELVAVEMRWTPGTKYTASLRELDFALITGSQYPNRPDRLIDQQLAAAGWALLPTEVAAGQTATGWLVFKIDPKAATSIRLDYTRPEIAVTGTRTRFPKKVFSLQIVG